MTTEKKVARRKLTLLELAGQLGNVSRACRIVGYSRQQFYEIRRNFQTYGADGLLDRIAGPRNPRTPTGSTRTSKRPSSTIACPTPATAPCGSPANWRWPASRSRRAGYAACGAATACSASMIG